MSKKDDHDRESHKQYCFSTAKIQDYNAMIDRSIFFDQPVKIDLKTYDKIRKISAGQGDNYTTGCLSSYLWFKK